MQWFNVINWKETPPQFIRNASPLHFHYICKTGSSVFFFFFGLPDSTSVHEFILFSAFVMLSSAVGLIQLED
jgi:hypothetical protein